MRLFFSINSEGALGKRVCMYRDFRLSLRWVFRRDPKHFISLLFTVRRYVVMVAFRILPRFRVVS
jgi:hypothetical protein